MHFQKLIHYLVLAILPALSVLQPVKTCPYIEVYYPTLHEYPVEISTFIEANTILNINGGVQITINNTLTH